MLLAQYVRFGEIANTSGYSDVVMTLFSFLFAALWLSSLAVFQTRSPRVIGAGIDEYRRIGSATFWTFGIIAMVTLLAKVDLARGYLAIALPVGTIGLLSEPQPVAQVHRAASGRTANARQRCWRSETDRRSRTLRTNWPATPMDGCVVVGCLHSGLWAAARQCPHHRRA